MAVLEAKDQLKINWPLIGLYLIFNWSSIDLFPIGLKLLGNPSESHSHADISNTNPILLNAFLLLHEYSERIFFMSDIINPGERV